MDDLQIIGADGYQLSGDDANALLLVSGYESGDLSPDIFVGAAPRLIQRPLRPAVRSRLTSALTQARPLVQQRYTPPAGYAPQAPQVVRAEPGPIREVVQGLLSASVAAGAQATVTFNVSMVFRPSRLMVGPTIAPNFAIIDIKVGPDSLFLAAGAVPGEAFLPGSVGASALKRRTAAPGTPINVVVENIDGAAHVFRGALFGEGVDSSQCGA